MFLARSIYTISKYALLTTSVLACTSVLVTPDIYYVNKYKSYFENGNFNGGSIVNESLQIQVNLNQILTIGDKNSILLSKLITGLYKFDEERAYKLHLRKDTLKYFLSTFGNDSMPDLVKEGLKRTYNWIDNIALWYLPNYNTTHTPSSSTSYNDRKSLQNAILSVPIKPDYGYGFRKIEAASSNAVLFHGNVGDSLDYKTCLSVEPNKQDPVKVDIRIGQTYRVNDPLGYICLPIVAAHFWISNRYALKAAVNNSSVVAK